MMLQWRLQSGCVVQKIGGQESRPPRTDLTIGGDNPFLPSLYEANRAVDIADAVAFIQTSIWLIQLALRTRWMGPWMSDPEALRNLMFKHTSHGSAFRR